MSIKELNDGLAAHMVQPGDQPLNPTGKQGSPMLRMQNRTIAKMWREFGDTPCTEPGFEGMTWFEAHTRSIFKLYVYGDPDATREVNNRVFGRVPLDIAASFTMRDKPTEMSELTLEELAERAEKVTKTIAAAMAPTTIGVVVDAVMVDEEGSSPVGDSAPVKGDEPSMDGEG